jgi:hypothetical protein
MTYKLKEGINGILKAQQIAVMMLRIVHSKMKICLKNLKERLNGIYHWQKRGRKLGNRKC